MTALRRAVAAALLALLPASAATAEVIHLVITSREPFAADVPGKVGPYERLRGRVVYALDPGHDANRRIVDLAAATPNEQGRVEFYADLEILVPVDRGLARPTVLYVVNNRGRLTWGADPFLLARGYVTVSSGWIAEVPPSPGRLRLEAPVAHDDDGVNVVGTVRAEFVTDRPVDRLPVSNQLSYEPLASRLPDATLTRRLREKDPPQPIARDRWRLLVTQGPGEEGSGLVEFEVALDEGFEPGVIYELIYDARGAVVQGTGFAAIRDLVSLLKHDGSAMNPLRGADGRPLAGRIITQGRSQSGRAIRMFLREGFNADEQGRQVFDGVMPTIAGGGQGFFNHRFASPTRTNTQHSGHLYPADVFPFAYGEETDPFSGRRDSILRLARVTGTVPKVMHLDTASEYWHRSGSLVVTGPLGERDAAIPPEVRVYVFGGTQHSPAAGPSDRGQFQPTTVPYRPFQQALFLALDRWITDGTPPPPSVHPRIADGTLGGLEGRRGGLAAAAGHRVSRRHSAAGASRLRSGVRRPPADRPSSAAPHGEGVPRAGTRARRRQQRARGAAVAAGRRAGGDLHRLEPPCAGDRRADRVAPADRRRHPVPAHGRRPRADRRSAAGGDGAVYRVRRLSRAVPGGRGYVGGGRLPAACAPRRAGEDGPGPRAAVRGVAHQGEMPCES